MHADEPGAATDASGVNAVAPQSPRLLSVIIPAHNEADNLEPTVSQLALVLERERIPFEVIVVNDNSTDATLEVAQALAASRPEVRLVDRRLLRGFGRAVRAGLEEFRGDAVVLVMADRSDDPEDVVRYYRKLEEGYDCVFGSRFRPGSRTGELGAGVRFGRDRQARGDTRRAGACLVPLGLQPLDLGDPRRRAAAR